MSTLKTIHRHRSIRSYKPDPVPDELLNECLAAGVRASSAGNMQPYSMVVTRDRGLREELYKAHYEQDMVREAPVLVTFCADFRRMRMWLKQSDAPDNFDNFVGFLMAAIDVVLTSQNMALAAEARGLGICYLGTTLANCREIGRILKLPANVFPVTGFTLGYPAEDPPLRDRLPLDGLVHHETFHDYSPEQVAEIYREREIKGWERYMTFPELRKKIEASGVKNLAQVYTVVKYTREDYREMSEEILGYLADQDFMN